MKKSKFQIKVWQATIKRKRERRDNTWRAAWNRVGARFRMSATDLKQAKQSGLNPHLVLHDPKATLDSVLVYINTGRNGPQPMRSWADMAIDEEIARLESDELDEDLGF